MLSVSLVMSGQQQAQQSVYMHLYTRPLVMLRQHSSCDVLLLLVVGLHCTALQCTAAMLIITLLSCVSLMYTCLHQL